MRAEATVRNSLWGLFQQFVICILSLFSRRVMLETIGIEGVGLNGLLTNVVAVLSLAEMGVGTAVVFHMYKPIAQGDTETITRLMNFYRTIYRVIAATIFAVGICLMPFMKYIVKDVSYSNGYVMWIYFLFLMQTVTTYLFAYKRSMLLANQQQYIISIFDLIFKIVTVAVGVAILLLTKSFSFYLIFLIVAAVINNLLIARKVDSLYPYVKNKSLALQKEHKKDIFKDIKNIFISKMSGTITNSTDNILISALVGTIVTGLYSNYTIILNTLTQVMNQFSYAMTGSIGNLLATETSEHIETVLKRLVFIMFFMAAFCCACLSALLDPFITIAFGDYLLPRYVVYISIGVFYFATIKIPVWAFISTSGLFKEDKYISIAGSTINLLVSFVLGKIIGIAGILLGTICTYVIQYNFKIVLFYKKFLHKNCFKMLLTTYFYFCFTAAECLAIGFITRNLLPDINPIIKSAIAGIIAVAVGAGVNSLIFWKKDEFKYFRERMTSMLMSKLKKA